MLLLGKDKTQKEDTMKQSDDRSRRRFLKASSMLVWQPHSAQGRPERHLQIRNPKLFKRGTP
jgi:hypothetical protein